jgi:D-aminopeptidase
MDEKSFRVNTLFVSPVSTLHKEPDMLKANLQRMAQAATVLAATAVVVLPTLSLAQATETRPRARELGLAPGILRPGPLNAITDVNGVRVGHVTLIEGDNIRTGVTAILPHGGNLFQEKVPGAVVVANGFGKFAGSTQVQELGEIETPIVLTNTLSVPEGIAGAVEWILGLKGNESVRSVNAVVGETNDGGFLNDIRARRVTKDDVKKAITTAATGPVEEGNVGAGTGTHAFAGREVSEPVRACCPRESAATPLACLCRPTTGAS